jgi:hypothetical protein
MAPGMGSRLRYAPVAPWVEGTLGHSRREVSSRRYVEVPFAHTLILAREHPRDSALPIGATGLAASIREDSSMVFPGSVQVGTFDPGKPCPSVKPGIGPITRHYGTNKDYNLTGSQKSNSPEPWL